MEVEYPLKFRLRCPGLDIVAHCGVREFVAEEGRVYLPFWLLSAIGAGEDSPIVVTNVALPKATYVKLRPRRMAFVELTDPKGVLEVALREFTCVTQGVAIRVPYIGRTFDIDILEVKPVTPMGGASIVETDVEIDFAAPLDAPPEPEHAARPAGREAESSPGPPIVASADAASAASFLLRRSRMWRARERGDSFAEAAVDGSFGPGRSLSTAAGEDTSAPGRRLGAAVAEPKLAPSTMESAAWHGDAVGEASAGRPSGSDAAAIRVATPDLPMNLALPPQSIREANARLAPGGGRCVRLGGSGQR